MSAIVPVRIGQNWADCNNKAAYQQSPFLGPLLQPQRGENDDHFNPVLNLLFCSCFHGMVICVFFLVTSHGLR